MTPACLLATVVEVSDATRLACFAVVVASFFVYLIILPSDPLFIRRKRSPNGSVSELTGDVPHGFQIGVAKLMGLVMSAASISWFAVLLSQIAWGIYHQPTNAEMAGGLRHDAAKWKQLADENPSLAKEYLRLADKSNQAADRRYRMSKGIKP